MNDEDVIENLILRASKLDQSDPVEMTFKELTCVENFYQGYMVRCTTNETRFRGAHFCGHPVKVVSQYRGFHGISYKLSIVLEPSPE